MFFIPIAAVVIFVWYLFHLYMGYNEGKYNHERRISGERTEKMLSAASDRQMESRIRKELTGSQAIQTLRDYLPDSEEWRFYADRADNRECAVLIRMTAHGKLPEHFIWAFGDYLRVRYDLPPADLRRCAELNERFLLMMESELIKRGIDTVLLFQRRNPKTGPWTPMRQYREENGGGFTDNSFMYRFTSK